MTTNQIAEYSATEAALAALREKYATAVFDVSTSKGMKEAREARGELRGYRTSLEKMRQELKAPLLARSRLLDSEAKRITAELLKLEEPIDTVIKAEEERKAAEKAAAEEAERQRIARIQEQISQIRAVVVACAGKPAAQIEQARATLACREITLEEFAEFTGEALQAQTQSLDKLTEMRAAAADHEAEQARIQAERAELEKLRAEQAERERQAKAEQDRIAAEQAAQQAELDRQRRAFEAQQAAVERAREAEAEAKAQAERELAKRKAREQFLRVGPPVDELLEVLASHYRVDADTVRRWLASHTFDQLAA